MNGVDRRVVALVDMDCFYCQVEERLKPELKGKPVAVVQYNQSWKGGGIIAVNYTARGKGVTRHMRGTEAKEICSDLILVPVPTVRGKADLTNYRDAGDEVAKIFSEFSDCVQRASIDEAYLDLTKAVEEAIATNNEVLNVGDLPTTFVVGHCDLKNKNEIDRTTGLNSWLKKVEMEKTNESPDYQLAIGAKIVEKMRSEIFKRTGFHCSAGISHNKILAKLTAGLHKPNKQTILPIDSLPEFYETLPIQKVKNLGGKLGQQVVEKLSINYMSELYNFSLGQLNQKFDEKTSYWLYNIARGINLEPVTPRLTPESIGCCKNFTGKNALKTKSEVEHWMRELASEISERLFKDLEKHNRRAKQLTVSFSQKNSMTRCGALNSYDVSRIVSDAMGLIKKFNSASASADEWFPPIRFLGLTASKFTEEFSSSIEKYLSSNREPKKLKSQELPSCSSTLKENDEKANHSERNSDNSESEKKIDILNCSFKEIEKSSQQTQPQAIANHVKPSFFLEFLNANEGEKKEEHCLPEEKNNNFEEVEKSEGDGDEEDEVWISLTELFPDVNQAEPSVVESLPEALQKKFREKVNSINEGGEVNENPIVEGISQNGEGSHPLTNTCSKCGKNIPQREFSIHLDYHAALELNSELNKPTSSSVIKITKKSEERETKRKKKGPSSTPSKKMKSLKSFFTPIAKE